MLRSALRATATIASSSRAGMRPTVARAVVPRAAPVIAARGYHAKVIDHYENPRNVGKMNKDDDDVGTGLVGAPACGE